MDAARFKKNCCSLQGNKFDITILISEVMAKEMGLARSKLNVVRNSSRLLISHPYALYYQTNPKHNVNKTAAKAQEGCEYLVNNDSLLETKGIIDDPE